MTERESFLAWFLENYPSGCVIRNPTWHAEKIFARANPASWPAAPGGFAPTVFIPPYGLIEGEDYQVLYGKPVATLKGVEKMIKGPGEGFGGGKPIGSSDRNPIEQDADVGVPALEPPASPVVAAAAVVVDDVSQTMLPELRPLVDRITELDSEEREEVFTNFNLIDAVEVQFIRREQPGRAAADAAIIRHALTRAFGGGGEASTRLLRNLSDVVERRLAGARLRAVDARNQRGA